MKSSLNSPVRENPDSRLLIASVSRLIHGLARGVIAQADRSMLWLVAFLLPVSGMYGQISFTPPSVGDRLVTDMVSIAATAESGDDVTLTLTGPATFSDGGSTAENNGVIMSTGVPGLVTVDATGGPGETGSLSFRYKLEQAIAVDPVGTVTYGDLPFQISGTATSGNPVQLSALEGPAVSLGDNRVVAVGAGTVDVLLTVSGDLDYFPASTTTSFIVQPVNVSSGQAILDEWSWRFPLPDGNPMQDVSYRGGATPRYVAVGVGGAIRISPDGGTWTNVNSGTSADLFGVDYNSTANVFVAVGAGGVVRVSADGENWSAGGSTGQAGLRSVAYIPGANVFIAVDGSGNIHRSTNNGQAWSTVASVTVGLNGIGVSASGNVLVAAGDSGTVLRSTDGGNNWTVITSGTVANLHAVAAGSGEFYITGDNGLILHSVNGLGWQQRFTGSSGAFRGIAAGNGYVVAVGLDGQVLISQDGISWSRRSSRFPVNFRGLTYAGGVFVGAGDGLSLFTSPSGEAWTLRDAATTAPLNGVAFGNGTYVAAGGAGRLLYSQTGAESWQSATVPAAAQAATLRAAAHGGGRFVVVGDGGTILHSANGTDWSLAADSGLVGNALRDVHHAAGQFVAVGDGFSILTSNDGNNWVVRATGSGNALNGVRYGNGQFVAVGDSGLVLSSFDGIEWFNQFTGVSEDILAIGFGDGVFVAVGEHGLLITSELGENWTRRESGSSYALRGVAYGEGVYSVVGTNFTVLSSTDARNWNTRMSGNLNALNAVVFAENQFVAAGDFNSILTAPLALPTGLDEWVVSSPFSDGPNYNDSLYANGGYIAVGDGGRILTSDNGQAWVQQQSNTGDDLRGVAFGNGRYVVVGTDSIHYSDNRVTWRSAALPTNIFPFNGITYGRGLFVAVGNSNQILVSTDGILWTQHSPGIAAGANLHGVRYIAEQDVFVVVGSASPNPAIDDELMTTILYSRTGQSWSRFPAPGIGGDEYITSTLYDLDYGDGLVVASGGDVIIAELAVLLNENLWFAASPEVARTPWFLRFQGGEVRFGIQYAEPDGKPIFALAQANGNIQLYDPRSNLFPIRFTGASVQLNSITYGAGQFLVTGNNGVVLTSPTGDFWQMRNAVFTQALNGINDEGLAFVAVGDGGQIFTSVDASEWDFRESGTAVDLMDVAYAPDLERYAVVGGDGVVLTSDNNGVAWTMHDSGAGVKLQSIAYGHGLARFVAVGDGGSVVWSEDGFSWQTGVSGTSNALRGIAYHDGLFVAVGDGGTLLTSANGENWTARASGTTRRLYDVAIGPQGWVLVGQGGFIAHSADGQVWTAVQSGVSSTLHAVSVGLTANNTDVFLAAGVNGALLTSFNGIDWLSRNSNTANSLNGVGFVLNNFVVVGGFSTILTSSDLADTAQPQTIAFDPIPDQAFGDGSITLSATASSGLPVQFRLISGQATINGDQLTVTGMGTIIVEAFQPGNALFAPANPVRRSFSVGQADQFISFPEIENKLTDTPPFFILAQASSGLPVAFSVVEGQTVVSLRTFIQRDLAGNETRRTEATLSGNSGQVTIRATQAGNAQYKPAEPVERSFYVSRLQQNITFAPVSPKTFGDGEFSLGVTADGGGEVTLRLLNDEQVAVIKPGTSNTIVINGAGTIVVEATAAPTGDYGPAKSTLNIEIAKAAQRIEFDRIEDQFLNAPAFTLRARTFIGDSITPADPALYPVSFSVVSGPAVIVNGNQLQVTGEGIVVVQASQAGDQNVNAAAPAQQSFTSSFFARARVEQGTFRLNGAAFSDDFSIRVVVGQDGVILRSVSGGSWTQVTSPVFDTLQDVIFAEGRFLAVGWLGTILESVDGRSWEVRTVGSQQLLNAMAYGNGVYVAVGPVGAILRSLDGRNWGPVNSGVSAPLERVIHADGRFFATGAFGTLLSSEDGLTWTRRETGTQRPVNGISYGGDRFLAVGPDNLVLESMDGNDWQRIFPPQESLDIGLLDLRDVAYGADSFYIVGSAGNIITFDPVTREWRKLTPVGNQTLTAIVFGDRFLAVGEQGTLLTSLVPGNLAPSQILGNPYDLGQGWRYLDWFGAYHDTYFPWILHETLGWIFIHGAAPNDVWFYFDQDGWYWSTDVIYPWIYDSNVASWLFYDRGSDNPRYFYHYNQQVWEAR